MSIKHQTLPVWNQMLATVDGLLAKAEAHEKGEALLQASLAEDMHPLATQIRFVCNMPGEAMVRLAGLDFTSSDDDPATLAESRARIAATREAIAAWEEQDFVADDAAVELVLPNGMTFDLSAAEYVRDWSIAQFYFHVTTAYAILRKEGLAIGKIDYVPYMLRYMRQPAQA